MNRTLARAELRRSPRALDLFPLGLTAIGLVLVFDALSSHDLEWPLGLLALVGGVIWLVGCLGWWMVWKKSDFH